MMKPPVLGYQKINMCLNFCMLYHFENTELTECETFNYVSILIINPELAREELLSHTKNLDIS
jgi:hypothetical protein